MNPFKDKLVQRKFVCVVLGILFGFACCGMAGRQGDQPVWGTPLMWSMLWNRMLIGIVVFIAGAFNYHALFKFRFYPWLRGLVLGMVVSGGPAIGSMMGPQGYRPEAVWGTIVMGGIYGLLIDVIATRLTGEGRALTGDWSR